MSDLFGNPEDRFSRDTAHFILAANNKGIDQTVHQLSVIGAIVVHCRVNVFLKTVRKSEVLEKILISTKNISIHVYCSKEFFFGLMLNVPVHKFSVMLGQSHRFLGITSTFLGVNMSCSRTQHGDPCGARTPDLWIRSPRC